MLPSVTIGMKIRFMQHFDSGMNASYEGDVTFVGIRPELRHSNPGLEWIALNTHHYFVWRPRAEYEGKNCVQSAQILRGAEPANKSMWLVVVGLERQVWVRDDSIRGTAREHWRRVGDDNAYTWKRAWEIMQGNPMMPLRVDPKLHSNDEVD